MEEEPDSRPAVRWSGLSARLLILTVAFVMLSEVLIYVPSIANFRVTYLGERIAAGYLGALALIAAPGNEVVMELEEELLRTVGARGVVLKRPALRRLVLSEDMPPKVDAMVDLRDPTIPDMISGAAMTLMAGSGRVIRVVGPAPAGAEGTVELIMNEGPLREAMLAFSWRILTLSIIISLITAGLVYLSLHWLLVRPMHRISASMASFRRQPEDPDAAIRPSQRQDEIGFAERELADMQAEIRGSLQQKTRLAALGTAVSKVNHDLRNILATVQLVSDGLVASEDPTVRKLTPRLIKAIDRAIALCGRTLKYGRADEPPPEIQEFALAPLVAEVAEIVALPDGGRVTLENSVTDDFTIAADREQLFRVLLNLVRNAVQAVGETGTVQVTANRDGQGQTVIAVADDGPGLPASAREHLFQPFAGSARKDGIGLGLAIASDIVAAHHGRLELAHSDASGTLFEITLPQ